VHSYYNFKLYFLSVDNEQESDINLEYFSVFYFLKILISFKSLCIYNIILSLYYDEDKCRWPHSRFVSNRML
jgi:hypothetical protein